MAFRQKFYRFKALECKATVELIEIRLPYGERSAILVLSKNINVSYKPFFTINRLSFVKSLEIKSIQILPSCLNGKRIKLLQELDDIVMKFIKKHGIERDIWQFPTVLLPIMINGVKRESVVPASGLFGRGNDREFL